MQKCVSGPKSRRRSGRGGRQRRRRRIRSVSGLTDDLISEILARVPYRSLCRFKCVSRSWLALCSSPAMIRRTLSGFFFGRNSAAHFRFVSTLGRRFPLMEGPLFSFLPAECVYIGIVDSCNGLLLFDRHRYMYNNHGSSTSRYFVCNPATGNWIDLPDIESMGGCCSSPVIGFGFDPAESSHFRVFLVVHQDPKRPEKVAGVQIYSSETRGWAYRQSGWGADVIVQYPIRIVFFNGTLHLATFGPSPSIVTVDKDGKTWRTIPAPRNFEFIGLSRGCLYAVDETDYNNGYSLSIWALEDCDGHEWILKHTTKQFALEESYVVRAIHPEDTLIFLIKTVVGTRIRRALVSYDFMNGKEHTIKTIGRGFDEETLGYFCRPQPYPYIPCFSKWPLSDEH